MHQGRTKVNTGGSLRRPDNGRENIFSPCVPFLWSLHARSESPWSLSAAANNFAGWFIIVKTCARLIREFFFYLHFSGLHDSFPGGLNVFVHSTDERRDVVVKLDGFDCRQVHSRLMVSPSAFMMSTIVLCSIAHPTLVWSTTSKHRLRVNYSSLGEL